MRGCAPRRRRPRFCAAGGRALRRLRLLGLTYQRGTFESTCHAWHPCFTSQPVVDTHTHYYTHTHKYHTITAYTPHALLCLQKRLKTSRREALPRS